MVFGYGHAASKLYKLRDAGLGHDPLDGEYYNPPGGMLSFDLVPPRVPPGFSGWAVEDLSYTEDDMEVAHNRAIDHQLQQLYHALGLALALNRTLLMPAMACLCVRGWFPNEACRLPGDSRSSLPFRCTGDQVFNIEALMHPNISVAGSVLRVRPPGFAADIRLPPSLQQQQQQGRLTVTPGLPACKAVVRNAIWQQRRLAQFEQLQVHHPFEMTAAAAASTPACVEEQQLPEGGKQLVIPMGHPAETVAKLLGNYSSVAWLHLTNVTAAFDGFKAAESQQAFEGLLRTLVAEWCCRSSKRQMLLGVPNGHLHQLRPWGSPQRFCAKRLDVVDKVYSYFC